MKDQRQCKIINEISGEIITASQKDYRRVLKDTINNLTIDVNINDAFDEVLTYYKPLTVCERYNTIEEDANYYIVATISEGKNQIKNPYSIY